MRISHVSKLVKCIMKKIIQVLSTGVWLRYQYFEGMNYKFPWGGKNVLTKNPLGKLRIWYIYCSHITDTPKTLV